MASSRREKDQRALGGLGILHCVLFTQLLMSIAVTAGWECLAAHKPPMRKPRFQGQTPGIQGTSANTRTISDRRASAASLNGRDLTGSTYAHTRPASFTCFAHIGQGTAGGFCFKIIPIHSGFRQIHLVEHYRQRREPGRNGTA